MVKKQRAFKKIDEHYYFNHPDPDVYYQSIAPEPTPPVVEDALNVDKIPWEEIRELLMEYPSRKRNAQGVNFTGSHVKVLLRDGSAISGWLSPKDYQRFKREGALSGWRSSGRR